jgi:hypothetical protein
MASPINTAVLDRVVRRLWPLWLKSSDKISYLEQWCGYVVEDYRAEMKIIGMVSGLMEGKGSAEA